MTDLIRPDDTAPEFVHRGTKQRYAWAAAHIAGNSVLEVGAGTGEHSGVLLLPGVAYTGSDPDPGAPDMITASLPADTEKLPESDTVVALEVIEHILPHRQVAWVEACWSLTRMRLILSTPDADALRWYPQTNWIFGAANNPEHYRELTGWKLRRILAQACPGADLTFVPVGLDGDLFLTGSRYVPPAHWFVMADRNVIGAG